MTYSRTKAGRHEVSIARIGNPFFDALASDARLDERGIAWAFWRWRPDYDVEDEPRLVFRFDFLVEAIPESAALSGSGEELLENSEIRSAYLEGGED